jgi:hypothetical protein
MMNGAALSIAVGIAVPLLGGFFCVVAAFRSRPRTAVRDPAVSLLLGIACLALLLFAVVLGLAATGAASAGVLKVALLLTGLLAIAGMVLGTVRGLRSGGGITRRNL